MAKSCHSSTRLLDLLVASAENNVNDGYLGSGIRIVRSVMKYGRSSHKREILEISQELDGYD